jgi:hypothetical protein
MIESKLRGSFDQHNPPVVFTIVVLALSLTLGVVVIVSNEILYSVNAQQQQNITKTGIFNYTQTDASGSPDWINMGNWSLIESPIAVLIFDAIISMVKPDGSESHEHNVSNLVIPYAPINQFNSTIIRGTTTITLNDDGLFVSKVLTTITLNEKDISVYFDPSKIGTHFGNQSITGLVI